MPKQVVVIHGGDTYSRYEDYLAALKKSQPSVEWFVPHISWKDCLAEDLSEDYQVLQPRMPNKQNAQYEEWRIWFEKLKPFLSGEAVFVGYSLGGLFLVKYLSENELPVKIGKLILLAPPYDFSEIGTFKFDSLDAVSRQCSHIVIMHSQDDSVVPVTDARKYAAALPEARLVLFKDKGHFNQSEFAELLEEIKS